MNKILISIATLLLSTSVIMAQDKGQGRGDGGGKGGGGGPPAAQQSAPPQHTAPPQAAPQRQAPPPQAAPQRPAPQATPPAAKPSTPPAAKPSTPPAAQRQTPPAAQPPAAQRSVPAVRQEQRTGTPRDANQQRTGQQPVFRGGVTKQNRGTYGAHVRTIAPAAIVAGAYVLHNRHFRYRHYIDNYEVYYVDNSDPCEGWIWTRRGWILVDVCIDNFATVFELN